MDGRSKRPLWAALGVVVVAAVGGTVLATRGGDEPDADALLGRASELVEDAEGFRVEATAEERSTVGEAGGAGTETTYRTVTTGVVSGSDWRMTVDAGDWADEAVTVGDTAYDRSAPTVEALPDEPWVTYPAPPPVTGDDLVALARLMLSPPDVDPMTGEALGSAEELAFDEFWQAELARTGASLAAAAYLGGAAPGAGTGGLGAGGMVPPIPPIPPDAADPTAVSSDEVVLATETTGTGTGAGAGTAIADPRSYARALAETEGAQVVSDVGAAGGPTLRVVRTPPAALAEVAAEADVELPDGVVEIDLDPDGRPAAIRLTVDGEGVSQRVDVRFTDWGAVEPIGVPEGEVDPTPWIDEEALAAAREGITPVRPTVLPAGVVMQDVYAIGPEEAAEWGQPCGELDLVYGPPLDEMGEDATWAQDLPFVDIVLMRHDCALAVDPTPFAPGAYGDLPVREVHGTLDVLVGDTVARVDTYELEDDLAALVTSFQPFDLDAELARIAAEAEAMWESMPVGG